MKVIITGTTGMVGEGVLLECLDNKEVQKVLSISRKSCNIQHPKLEELLLPDFIKLSDFESEIADYDACFFLCGDQFRWNVGGKIQTHYLRYHNGFCSSFTSGQS